ncbi:MAG: PrsW family intramembrane metalloprotease [Timaviella obliquedivisa GSE-PSE-MK23-08B]|nr:PrsW family intramembrane metalloprotease [Timaviella obliquedivisa GSE-PSE-MK23-08B]
MVQSDLVKAQQGDLGAIAQVLNRQLQPRGINAKLLLRDQCLKILLCSSRPLSQPAFVQFIQKQITSLRIPSVKLVRVYSQQLGEAAPTWSQEFILPALENLQPELQIEQPQFEKPHVTHALVALVVVPKERSFGAIAPFKPARGLWEKLRQFHWASFLPYQDVFNPELYQSPNIRLLLFFVLFPLVVNLVSEKATLTQTTWLLGIYYASILGVVLHHLIQPPQFSWSNTLKCLLFTAFIGIPILLVFQRIPPFTELYEVSKLGFVHRLLGSIFGVGLLEEVCKALPVYFLLLRQQKLSDPHSAAFYGSMSGLGFAIAEGAAYSIRYAFGLTAGNLGFGSYVAANTIRFVSLPLFHAVLAGIVGYFMGLAAINRSRQGIILTLGIAIAATLHGIYNTVAGGISGPLIIGFSILLFFTYLRRNPQMVEEMRQAERGK